MMLEQEIITPQKDFNNVYGTKQTWGNTHTATILMLLILTILCECKCCY